MSKTQTTQRARLPDNPSQTENRTTKRKPKMSTWENSGGAREGETASWGLRGGGWLQATPCGVDSDLESVTGPTGIRGPGRGNLSGLCFFQEDRHRRETCGEILIIQIFENHLPNSKETVIFQYLPYY